MLHRGFSTFATDARTLRRALAEHGGILDALEARDGTLARRLMVEHVAARQGSFIRHWSAVGAPAASRRTGP